MTRRTRELIHDIEQALEAYHPDREPLHLAWLRELLPLAKANLADVEAVAPSNPTDDQIHAAKLEAALKFVADHSIDDCWPGKLIERAEHADVLAAEVERLRGAPLGPF